MADRTDISNTAVSAGYLQMLFTADDAGVIVTGAGTPDTIVCTSSSGTNKKSCFRIGVDQCSIATGSHNFDIASHNGTYGLKLGGTLVTASAAELNYNDITTLGTSQASKAVTVDSSGDLIIPDSDKFQFGTGRDMLLYHDGSHSYIVNRVGTLKLATEDSGIAVTIGHTTSEVTVADNLTVTGTLASTGVATLSSLVCTAAATFGGGTGSSGATISTTGTGTFDGILKTEDTTEATSATDGSLQTDGGLSVAKDCVFGDDVKLLSDSAVLNMGAGNDVTLTHDGTTGGTLAGTPISINSTGDLTLDSSTDIVVDAAGGNIEFKDGGTLQLTLDMDTTAGVQILKLGVDTDDLVFQQYDGYEVCRMADDRRLYFYDKGGEYIYGDGTDLHITSGADINIPSNIGLTFGNDGEKIEGDGTNLTLAGGDINLTAEADVNIPVNIGLSFGDGNQHIETDNTDFTITSDVAINLNSPVLDIVNQGTTIELKQQVDALAFDGASDNILNIDASNNRVGIGTAAPDSALHVSGTSTFTGNISLKGYDANTSYGIEIYDTGGQEWTMQYDGGLGDGGLHFTEVGEEVPRLFLEDGGNIGIGTTSPDTLLEVVGSFAANGPSSTFVTMASGDTSPDVSTGNIFKSHTDGVTIDQFDGGICGQIITIISGGATVYDVTSSELNGGTTNITTAAGDVTMWVCESATDWHLLSWMDLSIDLSSGGF